MRRDLLNYSNIYTKLPIDTLVKGYYYKLLRSCRQDKIKYKAYKQSLLQQIENLYDGV